MGKEKVGPEVCLPEAGVIDHNITKVPITRLEMAKQAKLLSEQERFGSNKLSVFSLSLSKIGEFGIGIQLYFMFVKYLGVLFTLMSIIAIPAIYLNRSGHGISDSIADPAGLAYFSVGNGGLHEENNNSATCLPTGSVDCSLQTIDTKITTDPVWASYYIASCDFIYSLLFLLFLKVFQIQVNRVIEQNDDANCTPNDYAVMVRNLPSDATEEEIVNHFNDLYDLSKPRHKYGMWFGCFGARKVRSKQYEIKGASPVSNLDHVGGNEIYRGSYVAQVNIAYHTAGLLRKFIRMEKLAAEIVKRKHVCEMYSSGLYTTPKDFKRHAIADMKLEQANAKWNRKTAKIKALKKGAALNTKCSCAYVVFNHVASQERCLFDYRTSRSRLARMFQPVSLRFRGKYALKVEQAPEPSNIIWENLEVSDTERFVRRSLTNVVTILLLLISCVLIYLAQSQQRVFKSKMPSPELCSHTIPAVFAGTYEDLPAEPVLKWKPKKDVACGVSEKRHFIEYNTIRTDLTNIPLELRGYTRCASPCTNSDDDRVCASLSCFDSKWEEAGYGCETYLAADLLYCMCKPTLASAIKNIGFIDGPMFVWENNEPCRAYLWDFATMNFFLIGASATVVIVNLFLGKILRGLSSFERHHSASSMASALTLKLFLAVFLNTALIALLVNAKMPSAGILGNFGWLFTGQFQDFEREWYVVVGAAISTTMIINVVAPHVSPLLQICVIHPMKTYVGSHAAVTQSQMNSLYQGPQFDVTVRFSKVLSTVFVTMLYCGGIPILLPIAAFSCFASYYIDKLSIIRLFTVRTAYDEALGKLAVGLLPKALLLHVAFSAWMYGNSELLQSRFLNIQYIMKTAGISSTADVANVDVSALYQEFLVQAEKFDPIGGRYGLIPKIIRVNSFPFFLSFFTLLVWWVLSKVGGKILVPILNKTVGKVLSLFTGAAYKVKEVLIKDTGPNYDMNPQFTDVFEVPVKKGYKVSKVDHSKGWRVQDRKLIRIFHKHGGKHRGRRSTIGGKNFRRLTWEAFRTRVPTYDMIVNPKYKNAAQKIQELIQKQLAGEVSDHEFDFNALSSSSSSSDSESGSSSESSDGDESDNNSQEGQVEEHHTEDYYTQQEEEGVMVEHNNGEQEYGQEAEGMVVEHDNEEYQEEVTGNDTEDYEVRALEEQPVVPCDDEEGQEYVEEEDQVVIANDESDHVVVDDQSYEEFNGEFSEGHYVEQQHQQGGEEHYEEHAESNEMLYEPSPDEEVFQEEAREIEEHGTEVLLQDESLLEETYGAEVSVEQEHEEAHQREELQEEFNGTENHSTEATIQDESLNEENVSLEHDCKEEKVLEENPTEEKTTEGQDKDTI